MLRYFNVTEVRRSDLKAVVYCPLVGKPSNSTNEWIAWVSVQREHEYFRNRYVKKICIYISVVLQRIGSSDNYQMNKP